MGKRWGRMIGKFSKSNSLRGLETPLAIGVAKVCPFFFGCEISGIDNEKFSAFWKPRFSG